MMGLLLSAKRGNTDYMVKSVINRLKILNEWEHKATLAIVLCINHNLNAERLAVKVRAVGL